MGPNVHWWFKKPSESVSIRFPFPPLHEEQGRFSPANIPWPSKNKWTNVKLMLPRCWEPNTFFSIIMLGLPPNHPKLYHFSIETITNLWFERSPLHLYKSQAFSAKRSRKSTKRGFQWASDSQTGAVLVLHPSVFVQQNWTINQA